MREIVTIQLGHCGNMIGCKFWEVMCDEHGITPQGTFCGDCDLQLGSAYVFFREGPGMRFVPRALLVDLEPSALEACRCSPFGQIYRPDNFIFGRAGASNNFAKGFYTDGVELMDTVLDTVRREAEACDYLSGFQMIHGLGGGTGSGLGSLLLEKLYDQYSKKIMTTYSVFPSARVSDTVVEPYNCVLSIPALVKYSSLTVCFDNEAIYNICKNTLRLSTPSFDDINHIMAVVMSGLTACLRFPGFTNVGIRKLKTTLTPFPNLHFFVPGYAPLSSRGVQPYRSLTLLDIVQQMLDGSTLMASVDPRNGKYITAAALFRGNIADGFLEQLVCEFQRKNTKHFVDWLPSYFTKGVCLVPPRGLKIAATFLANHTCILAMWKRVRDGYNKLLKRKAFLHWYTGEGMSEKDFSIAGTTLNNLIKDYETYEKALPEAHDDSDDEEEEKE